MTRQKTQNFYKSSPNALRSHRRSPKSNFKLPKRSPLTSRLNRVHVPPVSGTRFFHGHPKLHPIREDISERRFSLDFQSEFPANEDTYEDDQNDGEDEDGVFDWEEEHTLVAALLQDQSEESERDTIIELANNLQVPMSNQRFKEYFAEVLVPTYTIVKDAFVELDQKIDFAFADGLFAFDDASKAMEILVINEEDKVKASYSKSKNNIKNLFTQLEQVYKRRENLWTELQATLQQSAQPVLAEINAFPAAVERKISALEKLGKDIDKDHGESTKHEKMFKALLAKFA